VAKTSAGLILFRLRDARLEVLLVHLGGPLWARKDEGAWFIPKGEVEAGEDLLAAARREFHEETGFDPRGPFLELGSVKNKGGKTIHAWAFEGDCDPTRMRSNTFTLEWPPRSGRLQQFPEADRAELFTLERAREKGNASERPLIERLAERLRADGRMV
jgi:predicted NUDIX family NTP pyrophosphohydrolase